LCRSHTSSSSACGEKRNKNLEQRISKLKVKLKTKDEKIKCSRKKVESENKKLKNYEILSLIQLGCKFFSPNFAQLFFAQIAAHIR